MLTPVLILLACAPESPPQDTAATSAALPEIWGVAAAEDMDPADGVVEVHLTAAEVELEWVEGKDTKAWAYNGQVPGPLIQARVGDTVRVEFTNDLEEDETTIHWHGLRIDDEMDGVPAIQDPVQPGESFTYEFVVPDSGSFWYHPHVRSNEQIERGLQGLLVVHEDDAPDVQERYFAVDDAYLRDGGAIYGGFESLDHMTQMHGRLGNTLLVNGKNAVLEGEMAPQSAERWRIVNTANARTMYVSVEGADWRVIAHDGTLLSSPYTTKRAELPVGRRVDLEVVPTGDADAVVLNVELPGASVLDWSAYPVFEASLAGDAGDGAWQDWPAPALDDIGEPAQTVTLDLDADTSGSSIAWTINGAVYGEHDDITVQANTPSHIVINELSGLDHPFHLHGQFFQVVERNGNQVDKDKGRLDTVLVTGNDELVLATDFDNPGRWMSHCHILEHAELGMMTEMVVEE